MHADAGAARFLNRDSRLEIRLGLSLEWSCTDQNFLKITRDAIIMSPNGTIKNHVKVQMLIIAYWTEIMKLESPRVETREAETNIKYCISAVGRALIQYLLTSGAFL